MRFTKLRMFLFLNGLIVATLMVYFIMWFSAPVTKARVIRPYQASKVHVRYQVDDKTYQASYMRYDIALADRSLSIRYMASRPSASRVNSFMGIMAEPLGWWLIFLLASAMLLLTDNVVFSKHTVFRIGKNFPWITMEEFFRLPYWFKNGDETPGNGKHDNSKQERPSLPGKDALS